MAGVWLQRTHLPWVDVAWPRRTRFAGIESQYRVPRDRTLQLAGRGQVKLDVSAIVPPTSPLVLGPEELTFVSGAYYSPRGRAHTATLWQAARA